MMYNILELLPLGPQIMLAGPSCCTEGRERIFILLISISNRMENIRMDIFVLAAWHVQDWNIEML